MQISKGNGKAKNKTKAIEATQANKVKRAKIGLDWMGGIAGEMLMPQLFCNRNYYADCTIKANGKWNCA